MTDPTDTLTLFAHWLDKRRPSVRRLGDDLPVLRGTGLEESRGADSSVPFFKRTIRFVGVAKSSDLDQWDPEDVPDFLDGPWNFESTGTDSLPIAVSAEALAAANELRAVIRREHSEQPKAYVFMRLAAADSGAPQRAQEFRIPEGTLELMPDAAASRWRAVFWADDGYLSQLKGRVLQLKAGDQLLELSAIDDQGVGRLELPPEFDPVDLLSCKWR